MKAAIANVALGFLALVAVVAMLAFLFGYFDPDLADDRRWIGWGLIILGVATACPAMGRLAEDWPKLKPEHSVDLAFGQVSLGVLILTVACLFGGRFGTFINPLVEPTPKASVRVEEVIPGEKAGATATSPNPR